MKNGPALPPGLRFPTGAIIGKHLIIAGTYLAQSYQSFSLWALDLDEMTWSRIDPGTILMTGSWSRGELWAEASVYVIFGNRMGNLVEDYNRRLLHWNHVVYIELEAFGMYTYPALQSPIEGQLLGLDALEAELAADFDILCEDGRKIKCSRKLLEERWPWFKRQRIRYTEAAKKIMDTQTTSEFELPLPDPLPEEIFDQPEDRPDPRLTPRMLRLSEPYPITKALLQYFYTGSLITTLQHAPLVLSALLLLSAIYELPHLSVLVKHIMHQTLSPATSVGVYEVATLCDSQNLQIRWVFARSFPRLSVSLTMSWHNNFPLRALRVVMSSSRKGPRSSRLIRRDRSDRPPTGEDSHPDLQHHAARARGMSDAVIGNWANTAPGAPKTNGQGAGTGSNEYEPSRDSESEGFASRQNSSTDLRIRVNPNMVQMNTGLLKAPEEDTRLRGRSDSDTRGRSLSNAVQSSPALKVHITRESSVTPTRVLSSNEDQSASLASAPISDQPRPTFRRQSAMNSITYASFQQQRMNSPTPGHALEALGRGTGQHASEEGSHKDESPTLAPPAKLTSSVPPTSFSFPALASGAPSRPVSRKQSANVLDDSSTSALRLMAKSSRRRSLSDASPFRLNTTDAVQSTSSLATSIETPEEPLYDTGDMGVVPMSGKSRLPRKALKVLGDDNYDPSSDIYISDPRSDQRATLGRPSTADSNRSVSPEKSKKAAWRSRLLPISTSSDGKKGSKAIEMTKTRLNLWSTGTMTKTMPHPDDELGGTTAEKLINAHLL